MEDVYLDTETDISVVVPVYNGSAALEVLFQRVQATLTGLGKSFQVIFTDDFSTDNSWETIREIKAAHPDNVTGIRLARNFGQHNATLCGIKHARGKLIVTLDDDLEFSPEDIALLIREQERTGYDLVYGVDPDRKESRMRKLFGGLYKRTARFLEGNEKCAGSSFRIMKASLAKAILEHGRNFSFIDEFVLWHTSLITNIPIKCQPSVRGKSRYSFLNLSLLTRELVYFSSVAPLRLVTLLGTLMVIVNFIAGSVIIFRKLFLSISVEGYASLIVAILFSSGLIIFSLGIIAEYISKILKIGYQQPSYKEAEIL